MGNDAFDAYDDLQKSPSYLDKQWVTDDKLRWRLEVREKFHAINLRLGEIVLEGSFNGILTAKLNESELKYWRDA